MRITESEQVERKNRMLHTAYDYFCEHGIDGVSLAQIAKGARVSPNSIFRYFDSKAELVQCTQIILWEEITAHILQDSESQLAQAKNGLEEMEILLLNFKKFYKNHNNYILFAYDYKLFLLRNHLTLSVEHHKKTMGPIVEAFLAALRKGQGDGSIDGSESAETQFFTLWGVLRSYVEEIVVYDRIYEGENPWENHFDLILFHIMEALKSKIVP